MNSINQMNKAGGTVRAINLSIFVWCLWSEGLFVHGKNVDED
jgi:hypothetical protein